MKLDHIILLTRRLHDLAGAFERLGFMLTPLGEHGARFGTANRCITFDDHYIEILGLQADTPDNAPLRGLFEHSAAISMTSLLSSDIDGTRRDMQSRGIPTPDPIHFAREVGQTAHGPQRIEFAVLLLPPAPGGELPTFFTMHKTPEVLYSPEWRQHPNGAKRLLSAEIEVHDAKRSAGAYQSVGAPVSSEGGSQVILKNGPCIKLSALDSIQPRPASLTGVRLSRLKIAVDNMDKARAALDARGATYQATGSELVADCSAERHCLVSLTSG